MSAFPPSHFICSEPPPLSDHTCRETYGPRLCLTLWDESHDGGPSSEKLWPFFPWTNDVEQPLSIRER
eukprot:6629543-Prorocentrum_lima.AAC.1